MSFKQKIGVLFALAVALFGGVAAPKLGSVSNTSEYQATTTLAFGVPTGRTQKVILSNQLGTLGSVVVSSSTAFALTVWDATSTTDVSSTTVTRIATSSSSGTYTFDSVLNRGLIIDMPAGFNGDYVVTFRQR